MEFARQEYWGGLPFPSPGDLPNPGIEPRSPTSQTLYHLSHQGSPEKSNQVFPDYFCRRERSHEFQNCLKQQLLFCNGSRPSRQTCYEGQSACAWINSVDYNNYSHIHFTVTSHGLFPGLLYWLYISLYNFSSISGPGMLLSIFWIPLFWSETGHILLLVPFWGHCSVRLKLMAFYWWLWSITQWPASFSVLVTQVLLFSMWVRLVLCFLSRMPLSSAAFESDEPFSSVTGCCLCSSVTYFAGDDCLFPSPNTENQMKRLCWGQRSPSPKPWGQWGKGQLVGTAFIAFLLRSVVSGSEGGSPSTSREAIIFLMILIPIEVLKIFQTPATLDVSTMNSYTSVNCIQKLLSVWYISSIYNEKYLKSIFILLSFLSYKFHHVSLKVINLVFKYHNCAITKSNKINIDILNII